MKNTIVIIFVLFVSVTFAQVDKFQVKVEGLGCPFCAYGLEKKFKELKGIKHIKIQMKEGLMDFDYPAKKELSIQQVESQVDKAGYTAVAVTIHRANGKEESSSGALKKQANVKQEISFKVSGNCDMCKARIEKAALGVKGVQSAVWDKSTKEIVVKTDGDVSQKSIEHGIAIAGHDTESHKATDEVYNNLPPCCLYVRK